MDEASQKRILRIKLRKMLRDFPVSEKKSADQKIGRKLKSFQKYLAAKIVCFYLSKPEEVDTRQIIKDVLQTGIKKIILPRVSDNHLDLYRILSFSDLEIGTFGLLEPKVTCQKISADKVDLFIVPGLVFSPEGWRLGRGKGFYDLLLRDINKCKIGLAYDNQILVNVIHDNSDVIMDYVVTDKSIYTCNRYNFSLN
jgi:5-formyltetrahydrofolate cyclo-ligase